MSPDVYRLVAIDLPAMLGGLLAAVTCALLGNFLVLRRQALMGDAISHSVLPGLVVAFLVAQTREPLVMLLGAAGSGMIAVLLIEMVRRVGRVDPGASMGVVFSVLFALGVLLLEKAAVRHVDLDADCVLYGQPEYMTWLPPAQWDAFFSASTLRLVPRQLWILAGALVLCSGFVVLLFKELRIASFDPQLATAQGISARLMHYLLMVVVALATVAAFEAVGSILVIAMMIGPAVSARLLTDRLVSQVLVSVLLAGVGAIGGYWLAALGPQVLGFSHSVSSAGMIAVVCTLMVGVLVLLAPRHGVLSHRLRQRRLARRVLTEDLLTTLLRAQQAGDAQVAPERLASVLGGARRSERAIGLAMRDGLVECGSTGVQLTERGEAVALRVLETHRALQRYLVEEVGVRESHAHETAERLEHVVDEDVLRGAGEQ